MKYLSSGHGCTLYTIYGSLFSKDSYFIHASHYMVLAAGVEPIGIHFRVKSIYGAVGAAPPPHG